MTTELTPRLRDFHPLEYLVRARELPLRKKLGAALSIPYPADELTEPEYVGLTYGEVAILKQTQYAANGSLSSLEFLFDRIYGKPQNTQMNLNATVSYQDFLDGVQKQIDAETETIDVPIRESDKIT